MTAYLTHTQTGPLNCLQTAIACILRLDPEEVPDFYRSDSNADLQRERVTAWAATCGLTARHEMVFNQRLPDRLCVAVGYTPGFEQHAVIADGGEVVWDPSPSREGLALVTDITWFERTANE